MNKYFSYVGYIAKILVQMNIGDFDWEEIQNAYNRGESLENLGVTRRTYEKALRDGLLKKRKKLISEETKKKISEKRKKWLTENPEDHPWRKKSKFLSVPCEKLKDLLRKNQIEFEEEVLVSKEKNYSVDILIPSKNLIIEVNGNQHYDRKGNLQPYYQERHDHITNLGWAVIEMHYSLVWNDQICLDLIRNKPSCSKILEYSKKEKKISTAKYGKRSDYVEARKKEYDEKSKEMIESILTSRIDFSKFGWVAKIAEIIGQKPQKVNGWMKRYMFEFYQTKCFKRSRI